MPLLEEAMPTKWVVWAANVPPPNPQLAEVASRSLCHSPFSEPALLEDVATVWKMHDGRGCDAAAGPGEVRSLLQRRYIQNLRVAELPPIDEAIADRMVLIARNFATDGNTYKATGDRLIHAFVECRLSTVALAAIPANQPPYAANAHLDTAEATIKEVSDPPPRPAHPSDPPRQITEPPLCDTLDRFDPTVSCDPTFVLVLWTIYAELWKARPAPSEPAPALTAPREPPRQSWSTPTRRLQPGTPWQSSTTTLDQTRRRRAQPSTRPQRKPCTSHPECTPPWASSTTWPSAPERRSSPQSLRTDPTPAPSLRRPGTPVQRCSPAKQPWNPAPTSGSALVHVRGTPAPACNPQNQQHGIPAGHSRPHSAPQQTAQRHQHGSRDPSANHQNCNRHGKPRRSREHPETVLWFRAAITVCIRQNPMDVPPTTECLALDVAVGAAVRAIRVAEAALEGQRASSAASLEPTAVEAIKSAQTLEELRQACTQVRRAKDECGIDMDVSGAVAAQLAIVLAEGSGAVEQACSGMLSFQNRDNIVDLAEQYSAADLVRILAFASPGEEERANAVVRAIAGFPGSAGGLGSVGSAVDADAIEAALEESEEQRMFAKAAAVAICRARPQLRGDPLMEAVRARTSEVYWATKRPPGADGDDAPPAKRLARQGPR